MSLSPGRSVSGPDDYSMFAGNAMPADVVGTPDARQVISANHSKGYHIDRERRGHNVGLETWGMQLVKVPRTMD
mgnify:CR=1 FL=1